MKVKHVLLTLGLVFALALCVMAQDKAQDAPANNYTPTEVQTLRLQVAQKDAVIAQQNLRLEQQKAQMSQADAAAKYRALLDQGEAIKRENKWDPGVTLDTQTLTFVAPPKPTPPAPKDPAPKAK